MSSGEIGFENIKERECYDEFFEFVNSHLNDDPKSILLKYQGKTLNFPLGFAITQIESRRKCRKKLRNFIASPYFLFPDSLASEQATDELVARFHAALVGSGNKVLDMTAGLGIDAMTIAKEGNAVTACEMIPNKASVLRHNAQLLGLRDFTVENCNCIDFIESTTNRYDVIFIDPARRKSDTSRAYSFRDCEPDILGIIDRVLKMCSRLIIKSSPLLDITQILREIPNTERIYIVSLNGECKEVLVVVGENAEFQGVEIVAIKNSDDNVDSRRLFFSSEEMTDNTAPIANENDIVVGKYLYEPDAALMKLNASGALCRKYPGMKKLGGNTSLYISSSCHEDFPGRIVNIMECVDKRELKRLKGSRLNVTVRNYPVPAEALRKKYGIKEGKDTFLYAFRATSGNIPKMLLGSRVSN